MFKIEPSPECTIFVHVVQVNRENRLILKAVSIIRTNILILLIQKIKITKIINVS